ncbi:hypothetical protein INT45_003183 [Circinella minor]|uniref:tRNA-5-taurinomethyluridine 2-sulfurtransferase n=1 Tax=Circinella minor TaxID=1195481 RepID=A0A8H7VDZ3_9FUNG|nr:hypothetical protein INT45_003183 [Circinella minor]
MHKQFILFQSQQRLILKELQQQRQLWLRRHFISTNTKHTNNNNEIHTLKPKPGDRVIVAMSGGVDSSVTAALLKSQGYRVQGIYMRNWDTSDERGECTSVQDWQDVQRTCELLKIDDCKQVNFVKEYWTDVFQQTIDDYAHGLTPNPDIQCNRHVKFGALLNQVPENTWLATGHYCRSMEGGKLYRGRDRKKDQSYFLSSVTSNAIQRTLFPLGEFQSKSQVKTMAHELGLHDIAKKRESMGICFIGQRRRFADFMSEYIDQAPGPAVDLQGRMIGQHQGLFKYTVGQASKICFGSDKWFVAEKRLNDNTLVCVPGSTHPALFHGSCTARDWIWIDKENTPQSLFKSIPSLDSNEEGVLVDAQVRYRMAPQKARLSKLQDGRYHLNFLNPIRAMAPGQQVVVYLDDWCLGGGTIQNIYNATTTTTTTTTTTIL